MPRPAPRVAPATSAILPCNTFFWAFLGVLFGLTAISIHLHVKTVALLMPSLRRIAVLLPAPPTPLRAPAGRSCDQHAYTSNRRSKQNPPCGAGKREQPSPLEFPVRQPAHARGTSLPLHPTTMPRAGRIGWSVAPG